MKMSKDNIFAWAVIGLLAILALALGISPMDTTPVSRKQNIIHYLILLAVILITVAIAVIVLR